VPKQGNPDFLYKAYADEKYAHAFVEAGKIRLGALRQYQDIEDAKRRDPTEGEAHVRFPDTVRRVHFVLGSDESYTSEGPGTMEAHSSLGNPMFLFCTSLPTVDTDLLKRNFGPFLVKIENPVQRRADIHRAMESTGRRGRVVAANVEYTKGDLVAADPGSSEGARLSYVQKAREFSEEHEFRFVAIIGGAVRPTDLPEYIDLDLGGQVSYAKQW
jgi:hypothetical protein